jgi:hypothetical protein
MRASRRPQRGLRIPWPFAPIGRRGYLLVACLSLAVLLVPLSHPALHPLEVVNPGADRQHACPLSHAAAALLIALPLLMSVGLWLHPLHDPLPWLGHSYFIHCLAPRPPPASSAKIFPQP